MTTPTTNNNFIDAPPPTVTNTILPPRTPAPITATNITWPTPPTSVATSDFLPHATSNTTTAPSTSDGNSELTCPHCPRALTHRMVLLGDMRIDDSVIHRDAITSCARINTSHSPPMNSTTSTNSRAPQVQDLPT
ncbi:unnamed protein product [Schistocephalus solidus]|uniref:LITAF domain-containing protein n=1 Tax=Schistocephalus solidus TaxID=70667 RepID=A0A183SGB6_SCHSO|nr:unnamed protein product [Schistocephalus solidus]